MNRITFLLFALILMYGCPSSKQDAGNDIVKGSTDPTRISSVDTSNLVGHMISIVGYDPANPPAQEVSNFWWVDGYVSSRDEVKNAHRGKWYRFYKNGTFEYGVFEKNIDQGTWKYDLVNETLFTKTTDGNETRQWRSMMSKTRDKLVLIGPEVGPNRGDQMMLQPYLQKPVSKNVAW